MNRCAEILNEIFDRSGLDRRDGHPLYAYRVTLDELERLRIELDSRLLRSQSLRTSEERAAFCLYSAEWFRREYESGHWSWDVIFEGFTSLDDRTIPSIQSKRSDYTIDGLKWWNLDVIRIAASTRYLASLVCNGGIPLNTLRNDGASLSRVFRLCLRHHEMYPSQPISEIVDEFAGFLPETLQDQEPKTLIAHVVTAIAELRRKSASAEGLGLSRREYLDREVPGWYERLPFRIEDEDDQSLLLTLLDVRRTRSFEGQPLAIVTSLVFEEGYLRLQRELQHPSTIESREFSLLCGLDAKSELYPRMNGFLKAGDTRVQSCTIAKPFEGTVLRMQKSGVAKLIGPEAAQKTTFLVRSGQELVTDAVIAGGEALPLSPWVFSCDDPFELVGVGSVRTRHECVFVAMPNGATIEGDFESTPNQVGGRNLFRINGQAKIDQEGTEYWIRTRETDAQEVIYELRGARRFLGMDSDIWLGIPKIVELNVGDQNAAPRRLEDHEVRWRPAHGGSWQRLNDRCIGDVVMRADVEGECRLLTRLKVFPASFELAIRPARQNNLGRWIFSGLTNNASVHVEPTKDVEATVSQEGNEIVVDVQVDGQRPERIRSKVRFNEQSSSQLDLVCPTQACELIGVGGRVLDARVGIPSEQLDGMRIRVIQPGSQMPYILELEHSQIVDGLSESSPGVWEYPLSFIKDRAIGLLAASDDPDGEILFGVQIGRSLSPNFKWRIRRYGYRLEPIRGAVMNNGGEPNATDCTSYVQIANPKLRHELVGGVKTRVIGLNNPKFSLPRENTTMLDPGRWKITHDDAPAGYYLVTGLTENAEILRPLRIANKIEQVESPPEEKPEEEFSFSEISTIRSRDRRAELWDKFFDRLSLDFGNDDWHLVNDVVESSMTLPITTFEAVTGLIRNPIAVAKYGILEPGNARLWERLEELPFLWCLISLESWIRCAFRILRQFQNTMEAANIPEERIQQTIKDTSEAFAKFASDRIPSMSCVSGCFFHAGLIAHEHLRMSGTTTTDYRTLLTALIKRHDKFDSRVTWPSPELNVSSQVREILETTPNLENRETHENQWPIINAPALAAIYSVYNFSPDKSLVREFKRLRSFDTDWFDSANLFAMYHVFLRRNQEEADWIEKIVQEEQSY